LVVVVVVVVVDQRGHKDHHTLACADFVWYISLRFFFSHSPSVV